MKKHKKHSQLKRPSLGNFGRNEWAVLGAPCGKIQNLALAISQVFQKQYEVAFIDASHDEKHLTNLSYNFSNYIEKQGSSIQLNSKKEPSSFTYKNTLSQADITVVNGNHFLGEKQIVILNQKKRESLSRKLDRLTDVILVLKDDEKEIPSYLLEKIKDAPVLDLKDTEGVMDFLKTQIHIPPLYGLVLNGGKSTRMGEDKYLLEYHGQSQLDYVYGLLDKYCKKTFISLADENEEISSKYNVIRDKFVGLGAYGGILSAFQEDPDAAYLVLAIDMPNVDEKAIAYLTENRSIKNTATAFLNPATNFPDPLFTIFEPKSYPKLLHYLSLGYSCPRKMLINENTHVISVPDENILLNINTPEEKSNFLNG